MTPATEWIEHAAALVTELTAAGKLTRPEWKAAVLAVPRHVFVPAYYQQRDGHTVKVDATHDDWLATVYSNTALVTKMTRDDRGHPQFLSSSSTPGLMTRMLETLDVHDGHRVLEIGTGTGYNAALLSHRLGDQNVYSIDVEPDLVDLARTRLAELYYHPTLVAGDGAAGLLEHAPFDRIMATCSVPSIPWPWVAQTTLGGAILADIRVALNAGNLARLVRTEPGRAEGHFDAHQASFMALRHEPGPYTTTPRPGTTDNTPSTERATTRDPRTPWTHPVVWFLTALRLGARYQLGYIGNGENHPLTAVFLSTPDGSRCEVNLTADTNGHHTVTETGPARLWAQLEAAYEQWESCGEPGWPRLGVTVTPSKQWIWVDTPDHEIHVHPVST